MTTDIGGQELSAHALFRLFVSLFEGAGERGVLVVEAFHGALKEPTWATCDATQQLASTTRDSYPSLWTRYRAGSLETDQLVTQRSVGEWLASLTVGMAEAAREDLTRLVRELAKSTRSRFLGRERPAVRRTVSQLQDLIDTPYQPLPGHFEVADSDLDGSSSGAALAVAEHKVWTKGKARVRCVRVIAETHDVNSFVFESVDGLQFQYLPGQSATIEVPIEGDKVRRAYTICSSPTRPERLVFTIKRVPNGLVSNWMADNVRPGFEMDIRGPGGRFSWANQRARKVLFLSGGSGVTPLLSMSRYIYDHGDDVDVVFWHGARAVRDIICPSELEMLEARMSRFRSVFCLSRALPEDNWQGPTGRLSIEILTATVPDFMERTAYLCGPLPFMNAAKKLLEDAGFPMENFHQESFGGKPKQPRAKPAAAEPAPEAPVAKVDLGKILEDIKVPEVALPAVSAPAAKPVEAKEEAESAAPSEFSLQLGAKGPTVSIAADDYLLEVAEENDIEIESSCRSGTCGTCKVKLLSGKVAMDEDSGLDPEDAEEGYVLSCVGKALSDVTIEV